VLKYRYKNARYPGVGRMVFHIKNVKKITVRDVLATIFDQE